MKLLLLVSQIVLIRRSHVEDVIQMRFELRTSVLEVWGLLRPFVEKFKMIVTLHGINTVSGANTPGLFSKKINILHAGQRSIADIHGRA